MTAAGPGAEILFAKGRSVRPDRGQAASAVSRVRRAGLQTANAPTGNLAFSAGKRSRISEIGRRVRAMNHAARPIDRRVADQP